jgi:F1F0 ATPase subunit 2
MNGANLSGWLPLLASFVAGLGLGLLYFGGLWYTIQAMTRAKRPALLFIGSFVLRLVVALGGIYLLSAGHWERMAVALLGMIVMRFYLTRRLGPVNRVAR